MTPIGQRRAFIGRANRFRAVEDGRSRVMGTTARSRHEELEAHATALIGYD